MTHTARKSLLKLSITTALTGGALLSSQNVYAACVTSANGVQTVVTCTGNDASLSRDETNLLAGSDRLALNLGNGGTITSAVRGPVRVGLNNGGEVRVTIDGGFIENLTPSASPNTALSVVASGGNGLISVVTSENSSIRSYNNTAVFLRNLGNGNTEAGFGGSVSSGGGDAINIVNAGSGNISVGAANAVDARDNGISTNAAGGGDTNINIFGVVNSDNGYGIIARGSAIGIGVIGNVNSFNGPAAIGAVAGGTGDVTISTQQGLIYSQKGIGIIAVHSGSGKIGIRVDSDVNSEEYGIYTETQDSAGGDITILSGASTGAGNIQIRNNNYAAISANSVSLTGSISVQSRSDINGGKEGVLTVIANPNATGNIDIGIGGAINSEAGILAVNDGRGTTDIRTAAINSIADSIIAQGNGLTNVSTFGTITSSAGKGIVANGSSVSIRTGNAVSAFGNAIDVIANGGGDIRVNANSTITSSNDSGIILQHGGTGGIIIAVQDSITTQKHGIYALLTNPASTGINPDLRTVEGNQGIVINAIGEGEPAAIKVTDSNYYGIIAGNNSRVGSTRITSAFNITGGAAGISSQVADTNATGENFIQSSGSIRSQFGIISTQRGSGTTTINANGRIDATNGAGIVSDANKGATTINVNNVITARTKGVSALSKDGNITVNVARTGSIDPDVGVEAVTTNGAIVINNDGLIEGDITGARLNATGTGTVTINNNATGIINGGAQAIETTVTTGASRLTNAGWINGVVNLIGNIENTLFSNTGTWNTQPINPAGNSQLSNIQGSLNNSGTINLAQSTLVSGNLINSGSINMTNMPGNTSNDSIRVLGSYTGGGSLTMNYDSAARRADSLFISGTASGVTRVQLSKVGTAVLAAGDFLPIVTATGGGAAGAFLSDTPFVTTGFLVESFAQNPNSNKQWGILQQVNSVTGDLSAVEAIGAAASASLDQPASAFVTAKRGASAGDTQFGFWMRGGAGKATQDLTTRISSGAFNTAQESRFDISHQMLQIGADFGILNMGGGGLNLHFGITGATVDADADRAASATQIKMNAKSLGGYVFLTNDRLTLDLGVRHEWRDYDIRSVQLFGAQEKKTKGTAVTASINASYRIGKDSGLQLTPHIGYTHGNSDTGAFAIDAATTYDPGKDRSKLGNAGVTLAYRGETASGNFRFEPYVSAVALRNWGNADTAAIKTTTGGAQSFVSQATGFRDAIRYSIGANAGDARGKISSFVNASLTNGKGINEKSMSIGARINF